MEVQLAVACSQPEQSSCVCLDYAQVFFPSSGKYGLVRSSLRVTLILGVPNVIKVVAQMLTDVCIAHSGVHGFESYLADALVSVIGCSQPGQGICYFIARYTTMAWNPHECYFASSLDKS